MFTHTITRGHIAGNVLTGRIELTAGAESNLSEAIPAGAGNYYLLFVCSPGLLKALTLLSNKALTVKTNSPSEPDNTIVLVPNRPFQWAEGDPALRDSNNAAINATISSLFITNPDEEAAATFELRSLSNPLD